LFVCLRCGLVAGVAIWNKIEIKQNFYEKHVDPTYRKMAVGPELFVSRPTFEPI
jgi:hypothetical protein